MVWFHDTVMVEQIHSTIHSFNNAYQEPLLCLFAGTVLDVRTQVPCIMEFTL